MERTIGSVIRDLRVAGGLQQNDVARQVGLSPQYWGDIEHGRRIPPPETIQRIADVLQVGAPELLWTWLRQQVGDEMTGAMQRQFVGDGSRPS